METCKNKVLLVYYGVLMFLFFQASSATDTISTNQPLSVSQTIVSSGEVFELGYFQPNPGPYGLYYIGMWYKQASPRTIVWVANRESPVRGMNTSVLMISNGNLIIHENSTDYTIWSTGVNSSRSKDVQAVLLDNGNLVLRDGPNSSAAVLWQSFDHPSNTWLPDAKLKLGSPLLTSWKSSTDPSPGRYSFRFDLKTQSLVMYWNGSKAYWSETWERVKAFNRSSYATALVFELNLNESYVTYSLDPIWQGNLFKIFVDVSGQAKSQFWSSALLLWVDRLSKPEKRCEVYNYCGSFGICNNSLEDPCSCLPGFKQVLRQDSNDFSGGCIREDKLLCGNGKEDMFTPLENIKLATDPSTTLVLARNLIKTCASRCLANCSCEAYAHDGNKCFMWTTNAFNLQQLDANQGHTFFLRVAAPNISTVASNQGKTEDPKVKRIVLPVVLSSLVGAAAFFVGFYCCIFSRLRRKRTQRDGKHNRELLEGGIIDDDGEHMCYLNLPDIMAATNAFSEENKLGEGGFGPVYKGKLPNGVDVAIKRLSKKSSQGLTEFKNEVVLIIKLQHKNLVRLLGYCVEGDEKLLIYEYMSNKSLDVLLFDSLQGSELDWEKRMKIINGTTRGLQYLHEDSRLRIIHRDLKSSNILLDDEMNPKISDFGTARIFGGKQIDDSTQRIVGTYGYMSPEYALGGMISEKADIYSFGVLLLEIISGKKATRFVHNDQTHSLIVYAWECWCETKGICIVDESLCGLYSLIEVMRCVQIALLCVQDHPKDRPTISQIVNMLSSDSNLPIPKQPTFSNVLKRDQQLALSINDVTQTEMEGR